MKRYEVIIEPKAEDDLFSIFFYIRNVLKEPETAKRIFLSIREQVLTLNQMPFLHALIDQEPYTAMGVRKMPVENYTAFYYVKEETSQVHIFRILYNRREWQNLI